MTNILYINGHPDPNSFHAAIRDAYASGVDTGRNTLHILNLGEETFDPVLRYGYRKRMEEDPFITRSQQEVLWADHIVFAYPIWWGQMPSLLSGWQARVFTPKVAFSYTSKFTTDKRLAPRTADIIVTSRAPRYLWGFAGIGGTKLLNDNLFALTGIKLRKRLVLSGIGTSNDDEARCKAFLDKVRNHASTI
ncbi:NAD(P)H-dependent oxidoreductase [Bifidobacterium scaligerum]|uniref:Flavodoxin family protein n=1 Tax=Bifidobacterium scaligerum TaxID=2052656 RepID=A0A2M9HQH3_9BIFI|nr:NAD(P)H-dependent oxidoreductase [Bifidobacterium scaligerum]PJM79049.1 flavodoxin family protein [Bifidobacterium scaligerum]